MDRRIWWYCSSAPSRSSWCSAHTFSWARRLLSVLLPCPPWSRLCWAFLPPGCQQRAIFQRAYQTSNARWLRDVEGIFPLADGCLLLASKAFLSPAHVCRKARIRDRPREELLGLSAIASPGAGTAAWGPGVDVVGAFVWPASAILLALYKDGVAIRWADVLCRVRCHNRPGCGCAGLVVNIPRRAVGGCECGERTRVRQQVTIDSGLGGKPASAA